MYLKIFKDIYHGKSINKRTSVFSIDIQPFGNLLVTSGQDWLIKIWSFEIKFNNKKTQEKKNKFTNQIELSENPNFSLETIEFHKGPVNIIRWSLDGQRFASGGDDGNIIVFENSKNPMRGKNWRPFHIFKNHSSDITDLSWSPNCLTIASSSLDGFVFVYNIHLKNVLIKLSGYNSWVKGVTWDPTGNLLATQSDDKKVILWKTTSWKSEKILSTCPENFPSTRSTKIQLFNRIAWTVCGRFLILSSGFCKKEKNSVLIVDRLQEFNKTNYFSCSNQSINVIRSSYRAYQTPYKKIAYSLSAFGSTSGKIDLWKSGEPRIFFSIKNLITHQILDISWSLDGYQLFICSISGGVFSVSFFPQELGNVIKKKRHFGFFKSCLHQFHDRSFSNFVSTSTILSILGKNFKLLESLRVNGYKKNFNEPRKQEKKTYRRKSFLNFRKNSKENFFFKIQNQGKTQKLFQKIILDNSKIVQAKTDLKKGLTFLQKNSSTLQIDFFVKMDQKKFLEFNGVLVPVFLKSFRHLSFLVFSKKKNFFFGTIRKKNLKDRIKIRFQVNYLLFQKFFLVIQGIKGNFLIIDLKKLRKVFSFYNQRFFPTLKINGRCFFFLILLKCSGFIGILSKMVL